jgi:hypothetical protein
MNTSRPMTADELSALGREAGPPCADCQPLVNPGWESLRGGAELSQLALVGSLRDPAEDEPTVAEFHPAGTRIESADAPIALGWFPYNRCDVWRCTRCASVFLRYTEYGGYYNDERIRRLDPALVENA